MNKIKKCLKSHLLLLVLAFSMVLGVKIYSHYLHVQIHLQQEKLKEVEKLLNQLEMEKSFSNKVNQ